MGAVKLYILSNPPNGLMLSNAVPKIVLEASPDVYSPLAVLLKALPKFVARFNP